MPVRSLAHRPSTVVGASCMRLLPHRSALGILATLLAPLHGCELRLGKEAPLRALYHDDDPAFGLPTAEVESSTSERTDTALAPAASSSTASSSADCPTEEAGLVLGETCFVGAGACRRVNRVECIDSELRCAAVEGQPTVEVCNGADDDCDGEVDNLANTGQACVSNENGGSERGVWGCFGGELVCNVSPRPITDEVCNGLDDDNDGWVDEQLTVVDGCTAGLGACERDGDLLCEAGEYTCHAVPGSPSGEQCNGVDDDCNGETDEGIVSTSSCTVGLGGCERTGNYACTAGEWACSVIAGPAFTEECNGVDDDCDGLVDDVGRANCSAGVGACERSGITACAGNQIVCDVEPRAPRDEICNDVDDDCDGNSDEDFDLGAPCSVREGVCEQTGELTCAPDGTVTCNATVVTSPETCNGEDDDCDGELDNGHVCPDSTVANTLPFTSGIWYVSAMQTCGEQKVLQVYPEVDETAYYSAFPCDTLQWVFRPSDGALTYGNFGSNTIDLYQDGSTAQVLAAPEALRGLYGFDGQSRPYFFGFDDILRRGTGAGEALASNVTGLYAVTADGRTLVDRHGATLLLDANGAVIEQINPELEFAGTMSFSSTASSVRENDIFLLYERTLPDSSMELVLFRIDASNQLSLVRRRPIETNDGNLYHLAISDGSIVRMSKAPGSLLHTIVRDAPDGSTSVLWRESESAFGIQVYSQLLIGPQL